AVYYLKLYFGEHFKYAFWRNTGETGLSLLEALEELEAYAFSEDKKLSELIRFRYSREDMRLYHQYMIESYLSGMNEYSLKPFDETPYYLELGRSLFPEDIWSLYWTAFIQTVNGAYSEGLSNFQELFAQELASCMETLPLAYTLAAICAAQVGNNELADQYTAVSESLYNEHAIDVAANNASTGYGFYKRLVDNNRLPVYTKK
ncbi:MAG: hypothetical protein LBD29_10780, partial [Treponema sp.]|nr:hypothetical protein [Treponema sp.]